MCTNKLGKRNRNVREKVEQKHEEIEKMYFDDQQSFDKSSSSSLSWGEDCEQEATLRVKDEYERMHRVLKGLDPIPPNYDKDEYKLWIKTFPSLRSSIQITSTTRKRSYPTTPMSSRISMKPVQPAIDEFITKLCHKLSHPKPTKPIQRERRKTMVHNQLEMLERDFESLLRISPAPFGNKSGNIGTRNLLNCATQEEYTSLPYLEPKITQKRCSNVNRKHLTLPPIDVNLNQFRSVSAMPLQSLQQGKCLSALSNATNLNFDLKGKGVESNLNSARNLKFLN
ncbi:uncharacterized protein [Onthophagus taurus]|uniref:uncharacterized protein n=1 Tax=Onthophagus taurus TaxID=166361 RepID=UPI0039BDB750